MKVSRCLYCESSELSFVTQRIDSNRILKCANCGLLMTEDLPEDPASLYGQDYFEKPEDTKTGYTNYFSSPAANLIGKYAFARLFATEPGSHLDLGCADGSLMEIFESHGFSSSGLEISATATEATRAKGLNAAVSDLREFPKRLPKSSLVTAFDVLEHLTSLKAPLSHVRSNLAEGGYFVFSTLAVKKYDPTEYWYNNSLEHCVYFTADSLTRILSDTFGPGRFAFAELDINGQTQFWGIAKQGRLTGESEILELIGSHNFKKSQPEQAYLLALFYAQLSLLEPATQIMKHFAPSWQPLAALEASFYHNFLQGKFAAATELAVGSPALPAATNGVFWQAFSYAESQAHTAKLAATVQESNEEIMGLREQVFHLRGQVHTLRNYHLIGKLIVFREFLGRNYHRAIRLRIRIAKGIRWRLSHVVPKPIRKVIIKVIYFDVRKPFIRTRVVSTKRWSSGPILSVVIPFYNRADTIDETMSSLKAQTFANFEVIIVDDGSTDPAAVDKLSSLDTEGLKAHIIHQQNKGPAAARNTGIQKAKGKYIICLDSDDLLEPTAIEKSVVYFETHPAVSVVSYNRQDFGVSSQLWTYIPYDPQELFNNNMVTTAAAFKKDAWRASGGYKSGLSYEDWEFWLNLAEHGFWGHVIPEALFKYRTSMMSRFVEDKDVHFGAIQTIQKLHAKYKHRVGRLLSRRQFTKLVTDPSSALLNLQDPAAYRAQPSDKPNVLITVPWMVFGGAETLIYNFCREIKDLYNISFVTALKADHQWEYKFREISPRIYHLANLFDDEALYLDFISNYIRTRNIQVLHIIHNGFTFDMLAELKRRFPDLKVAVTLFNDRVGYFNQAMAVRQHIDAFTSDNSAVTNHYVQELGSDEQVRLIPNGINCYDEFSPALFDRSKQRQGLGLASGDLAVFFVGRLSPEKNPNVFVDAAATVLANPGKRKIKFFMIGSGPMQKNVEDQLREVGSDDIRLLGYSSEVARYLSTADVFVLPSSIEGFPLSILEAMSMQVAVVASHVGAVPDVIEPGVDGFVVEAGSAPEIAETLQHLAGQPKLLESVKTSARKKVEKLYSNIALGQNYHSLYRELTK